MSTVGSNPTLSATPTRTVSISCRVARRGRLEAYGAALEMRFGATRRGFESPPLRHFRLAPATHRPGRQLTDATGRHTIAAAVLGGELAVPCTRNPLQRG